MNKTAFQMPIDDMFEAGAHYGYSRSRRHPSFRSVIFASKSGVDIIDLEQTGAYLERAKAFVSDVGKSGKKMLFVGTKPSIKVFMESAADTAGQPFVINRWIGGLLTNMPEIKKRFARLKDLSVKREKGELSMYTKKERLLFDREIEKLEVNFGGVAALENLPGALFVIDPREEKIAVTEALQTGVPVIALANSDCDISNIAYPIPANDSTQRSVSYFVDAIRDAYMAGRKEMIAPIPDAEKADK